MSPGRHNRRQHTLKPGVSQHDESRISLDDIIIAIAVTAAKSGVGKRDKCRTRRCQVIIAIAIATAKS